MRRPHITATTTSFHNTRVFRIGALVALCVYIIYLMTSLSSDTAGESTGRSGRCPSTDFVVALARHATPDKFIILALVDTAFADMAINLYESSLRPHRITNFLFIGAGRRACDILRNASLPCHHYTEDKDTEVASIYKSPEFIRKMNIRTEMILDALSVGFTVLHTDLDVVFLRNPLPDLKVVMLTADIATMWDSVAYNAGFVVVRPTWYARSVYERMHKITTYSHKTDDQTAMNAAIYAMNKAYKRQGFKAVPLNSKQYLCGLDYFEKGSRVFPSEENCLQCTVVHNNWIVSREAKIYRFKEHLMWMYDKDSYYSSPNQNYLVYHNPVVWNSIEANDREELSALRTALALGHLLGRHVVLPRFHCNLNGVALGASPSPSSHRRTQGRNSRQLAGRKTRSVPSNRSPPLPAQPRHECPINGLLNITALDSQFADRYRENSFLRHPLVPDDVRADRSSPLSIHELLLMERSKLDENTAGTAMHHVTVANSSLHSVVGDSPPLTLLATDAVRMFGAVGNRVLELQSLYKISLVFDNDAAQRDFDAKVRKAFQRGTYRQL